MTDKIRVIVPASGFASCGYETDLVRAAGQQREKTPAERRADEIEADPANYLAEEAIDVAGAKLARGDRTEAAAWLLVAQRLIAREAGR